MCVCVWLWGRSWLVVVVWVWAGGWVVCVWCWGGGYVAQVDSTTVTQSNARAAGRRPRKCWFIFLLCKAH